MPLSSVAKVFGGIISKRGILLAMAKNKFTKGMSEMIWNDCYSTIPGWNPNLVKYSKNNCSKFPPQILQLCVLLYEPTCCMGLVAFQLIELNFSPINPPLSLSFFFSSFVLCCSDACHSHRQDFLSGSLSQIHAFSLRNSADRIPVFLFKRLGIFAVKKKKNISIYISDNEADNFMHPENKPSYVVAVVL